MVEVEMTIKAPIGVKKLYQDYAKFVGKPLDMVLRSEIEGLAESLLDVLRGLPNFSTENARTRYGLEV